jgi:hypothetical protein
MTGPLAPLERSLRDGPPDEAGYRPRLLDGAPGVDDDGLTGVVHLERLSAGRPRGRTQAAPPWQYLAAALAVVVSIAALGIIGLRNQAGINGLPSASPGQVSPSPSARASGGPPASAVPVPPLTETFVSPRNGVSVRYPAAWTVTPATAGWPANTYLPYGNPGLDTLVHTGEARLVVASQPLGPGGTEEAWIAAFFRPFNGPTPCGGDHSTWPRIVIGGVSGYLDAADCPVAADSKISVRDVSYDALVFSGGRVYQFGLDGDVDLAYFEALLAAVQLDPSKAQN